MYREAIRLDPGFARAHADLAYSLLHAWLCNWDAAATLEEALSVDVRRVTELRQGFGHLVQSVDLEREYLQEMLDLFQTRVTGRGQDILRWPQRLGEQLAYLAAVVGGSDNGPTASQREVQQLLHAQTLAAREKVTRLLQRDVVSFNDALRQRKVQGVVVGTQ